MYRTSRESPDPLALFLVLIEDPLERAAVTKHVVPRRRRHTGQSRLTIENDATSCLVGLESCPRREPGLARIIIKIIYTFHRKRRGRLINNGQSHQRPTPVSPPPEVDS